MDALGTAHARRAPLHRRRGFQIIAGVVAWLVISVTLFGFREADSLEQCGQPHTRLLSAGAFTYRVSGDAVQLCGPLRLELCYCDRAKGGWTPAPSPVQLFEVSILKAELTALTSVDRSHIPAAFVPSSLRLRPRAVSRCALPMTAVQTDRTAGDWSFSLPPPTIPGFIQVVQTRGSSNEKEIGVIVDSPNWPQTALVELRFDGPAGQHESNPLQWTAAYVRAVVVLPWHALYILSLFLR